jgi:hypothetical protein
MVSNDEVYKGRKIEIHIRHLPTKEWMAEISIDGEPRPITRWSDANEGVIRQDALRSAKALIDTED